MPTLEIMEATMSGIASTKFPSVTSLALSIVSSILLLALIRAAFTRLVTISDITDDKSTHPGCNPNPSPAQDSSYQATSSWTWSKNWRWEGLPLSLPVSLAINEKDRPGVGEGMGVAAAMQQLQREQRQPPKMTWQKHRRSPAFQAPCKPPWFFSFVRPLYLYSCSSTYII